MLSSSRRAVLFGAASMLACSGVSLSFVPTDRRLVVFLLRGGLDGLSAVPVPGDPHYRAARGEMAEESALPLDERFALHPSLAKLMPLWERRELAVVHAVGLPYRERSHFDAQNVLESGGERPFDKDTGWLSRSLALLPGIPALSASAGVPLLLRGPNRAASADLRRASRVDSALLESIRSLYRGDETFGVLLEDALKTEAIVARNRVDKDEMGTLGRLLADPEGPRIAVVEQGGFDTHTGQRASLTRDLAGLAEQFEALRVGLGEIWAETAVLAVTEFGRCVHSNGTGGTDHGVGGAALLLGGAILGGRVIADWPGLAPEDLYEGRDLRPTMDLRAVFAATLSQHFGADPGRIASEIFSGAHFASPGALFRT